MVLARAHAEDPPASQPAAAPDDAFARKELRWGNDSTGGAPYVFQDPMDPNHLVGFEVDLADALCRQLGWRARPVQGQWENLLDILKKGDVDVALNGMEVAFEKRRVCVLSRPYYAAPERLTVRRGDPLAPRTQDDLRGRKIGTIPGSLAERILDRAGADKKTYGGGTDQAYADLKQGRLDGVLLDAPITRYYAEIEPDALEVVPGSFGEVRYAIALRLGDERLLAAIDGALDTLAGDGTLRRIYETWGLWNDETAALLGDPRGPSASAVPEAWERWRAAMGKLPPFLERVRDRYPATMGLFARGALVTLALSVASMALAAPLGVLLALLRVYGPRPLRLVALVYVEVFRGTPLLVQLTVIYFGLPEVGLNLGPFPAGVLALGLNYAAAEAENYRAGLESVPAGQLEAAWSLGLTTPQAVLHVIAPQAVRVALPPATNDFIALLKDSSLVSIVTLTELTKTYTSLGSAMRDNLGLGLLVSLWYLALGLPFARLARLLEARLGRDPPRAP